MAEFTFKLRRDTSSNWLAANPILADGEPGIESDTDWFKIGDGVSAWSTLGYYLNAAGVNALIEQVIEDLDISVSADWDDITNKPTTFAPATHNHDTRYYTEGEIDTLLADLDPAVSWAEITGKPTEFPPSAHNHNSLYYTETEIDAMLSGIDFDVTWDDVSGKPATFPPSTHTHDDRYFTESETTTAITTAVAAETDAREDAITAETEARTIAIGAAITGLINSAPGVLDTLDEIAAALGDDPNFAASMTTALAGKQAHHAILDSLAGLAASANKIPYFSGATTITMADFTSFARTLVAATSAADARTVLGLGTSATLDTPASGDASSSQVVKGNDSRLSDSRTPTSHNHAASEITSGVIAVARLGTGSAGAGAKALYDDGTWKTPAGGGAGPTGPIWAVQGILTVLTGQLRWYPSASCTIVLVRISVNVAPTGAALIVDVNKNGTTIFTTQSNRPEIAISGVTDLSGTPDITAMTTSDYLTFDIDQIGSTIAGAYLTVQVYVS